MKPRQKTTLVTVGLVLANSTTSTQIWLLMPVLQLLYSTVLLTAPHQCRKQLRDNPYGPGPRSKGKATGENEKKGGFDSRCTSGLSATPTTGPWGFPENVVFTYLFSIEGMLTEAQNILYHVIVNVPPKLWIKQEG